MPNLPPAYGPEDFRGEDYPSTGPQPMSSEEKQVVACSITQAQVRAARQKEVEVVLQLVEGSLWAVRPGGSQAHKVTVGGMGYVVKITGLL